MKIKLEFISLWDSFKINQLTLGHKTKFKTRGAANA